MLCVILKSSKKADTYLYLPKDADFDTLPETLQKLFTPQQTVMTLFVKPDKKLARFTGAELLQYFEDPGYYVQLPPAHDTPIPITSPEYSARIRHKNEE